MKLLGTLIGLSIVIFFIVLWVVLFYIPYWDDIVDVLKGIVGA